MSALVVVLKQFSPFSAGDKEIDLSTLPPPPAPEELHPMFMGEPSLTPFLSSKRSPSSPQRPCQPAAPQHIGTSEIAPQRNAKKERANQALRNALSQ